MKSKSNKRPHKPHKPRRDDDKKNEKDLVEEVKKADEERGERVKEAEKRYEKILRRLKDRNPEKVTPWLLIRYTAADLGARPIPPNTPFWISPDIRVESSSPMGNAVAGEENFIHARVFNLGAADAAPVKVDFYWADPSLGLGPGNMNIIGTEWVEVRSLHSKNVRCKAPWIPAFLNDGHECLMVNCTNIILDPILHPFEPVLDRHVGQRNIHVEKAAAAQMFKFNVKINNIFKATLRHQVFMETRRFRINGQQEDRQIADLVNHALFLHMKREDRFVTEITDPALRQPEMQFKLGEESKFFPYERGDINLDNRKKAGGDGAAENQQKKLLLTVEMKPFEQKELSLEIGVPADANNGELVVIQLSQEVANFDLGGYVFAFLISN